MNSIYKRKSEFTSEDLSKKIKYDLLESCLSIIEYKHGNLIIRHGSSIGLENFDYLIEFSMEKYLEIEDITVQDSIVAMEKAIIQAEKEINERERKHSIRKDKIANKDTHIIKPGSPALKGKHNAKEEIVETFRVDL